MLSMPRYKHGLSRETGVDYDLLRHRLLRSKLSWTIEGAVNTPPLPKTMTKVGFHC